MKPLVSIIIPCYNCEKWLAETLESALAQTWKNLEIIIVDDGSTDNSLAIARSFESENIKLIHQQNRGASAARNQAFHESKGDFIQYLDADDLLASDKIERQIQLLGDSNSEFVATGEWARFYKTPSEAVFKSQPLWRNMSPIDWLVCAWEGEWMMHPGAWLVPRNIAEKAGFWNENLSLDDDGEYFCRVVLASQGVRFCQGAKVFYRSGISGSLSASKSRTAWESAFHSLELRTSYLLARENSSCTRHACATAFQRFIYNNYANNVPDLIRKAEDKVEFLGGSEIKPIGGPRFQRLAEIVGWKSAKKIQLVFNDLKQIF
ncbi:glycosyl transferase 2 family protein [Lyngbya aestuarii BL J]|uniref:Glycosyl transferase 2 family protein n=1 Tax=Lyngbya aestuarii BL J TaxID=1348334 RepID=U7QJL3_9CYAN|nr:glycosyltransferase family 2 protein [Lyngbya aestuarii]ERT08159.1 glycosyl transferase 2 family protein [Lyngbya aestuarii BL J]